MENFFGFFCKLVGLGFLLSMPAVPTEILNNADENLASLKFTDNCSWHH